MESLKPCTGSSNKLQMKQSPLAVAGNPALALKSCKPLKEGWGIDVSDTGKPVLLFELLSQYTRNVFI